MCFDADAWWQRTSVLKSFTSPGGQCHESAWETALMKIHMLSQWLTAGGTCGDASERCIGTCLVEIHGVSQARKRPAYAFARSAIWTVGLGDEEALRSCIFPRDAYGASCHVDACVACCLSVRHQEAVGAGARGR